MSYCLGITDVDPVQYNLYFERFLNPERVSMPDIDVDFCVQRRGEVIDYVIRKYGADHVAQIVTFGTMAARAAVRDVGRVMNLTYAETDAVAKAIPGSINTTLDEALQQSKPLRAMYDGDERLHRLIDTARAIEGMAAPRVDARGGRGHHRAAGVCLWCRWQAMTARSCASIR